MVVLLFLVVPRDGEGRTCEVLHSGTVLCSCLPADLLQAGLHSPVVGLLFVVDDRGPGHSARRDAVL